MSIGKISAAYLAQRNAKQQQNSKNVARLYGDGRTLQDVAKACHLPVWQVIDILDAEGIERRRSVRLIRLDEAAPTTPPIDGSAIRPADPSSSETGLSAEVCRLYRSGQSIQQVATALDITPSAVYLLLDKAGVPRRQRGRPRKHKENPDAHSTRVRPSEADVINLYQLGQTLEQVAVGMNLSTTTVRQVLTRNAVPRRPRGPRNRHAPTTRHLQIAEVYQSGMTLAATGMAFGITRERVRQILVKLGLASRPLASMGPRIPREVGDKAAQLYLCGKSITVVAATVGVCGATVHRMLAARGIERRPPGTHERRQRPSMRRRQRAMARMYSQGKTCAQVARAFHMSPANVQHTLQRLGIPRRTRDERK